MGAKQSVNIQVNGKWFAKISEGDAKTTKRYTNIDKGIGSAIEKSTSYGRAGAESKLMYAPNMTKK